MHASTPDILIKCGTPEITYGHAVRASQTIFIKMKIANQNMLERILIAMHNENTAKLNENFRMGAEEPVAPLYNW